MTDPTDAEATRKAIKEWLTEQWQQKDQRLERMLS